MSHSVLRSKKTISRESPSCLKCVSNPTELRCTVRGAEVRRFRDFQAVIAKGTGDGIGHFSVWDGIL
jgi:hypothetical protein